MIASRINLLIGSDCSSLCFFQALEKVCRQLAEAEAAAEMRHKPAEETDPKIVGGGLVLDEWVR